MRRIRIIAVPPGDAPAAVRAAWVGLILPVQEASVRTSGLYQTRSVLAGRRRSPWARIRSMFSGERSEQPMPGVPVEVRAAVEILARTHPAAADWWRTHTPHLLAAGRCFVFLAACCADVSDAD